MYNKALPGEYLELLLPTLPTPPSSTENSGQQSLPTPNVNTPQNTMPTNVRSKEYLLPKESSKTYIDHIYVSDNCVTPPSNPSPGSAPTNHHPADNIHSDLTGPVGHKHGVGQQWAACTRYFSQHRKFQSFWEFKNVFRSKTLEKCSVLKDVGNKRSFSESSCDAL